MIFTIVVEEVPSEKLQCTVIFVESSMSGQFIKPAAYKKLLFCMIVTHQYFAVNMSDQRLRYVVIFNACDMKYGHCHPYDE